MNFMDNKILNTQAEPSEVINMGNLEIKLWYTPEDDGANDICSLKFISETMPMPFEITFACCFEDAYAPEFLDCLESELKSLKFHLKLREEEDSAVLFDLKDLVQIAEGVALLVDRMKRFIGEPIKQEEDDEE